MRVRAAKICPSVNNKPNIVRSRGVLNKRDYRTAFLASVSIVAVHAGSCLDLIQSNFKYGLNEMLIAYILREVLKALAYIHRLGFVHR